MSALRVQVPAVTRSGSPTLLALLTAVLAVVAGVGTLGTEGPVTVSTAPLAWLAVALGVLVTAALPVRVPLGRATVEVTAVDAVLAAGLWVLPLGELVLAVLLGALVDLVGVRRQRGVVLLANLAVPALRTVVAGALLARFGPPAWASGGSVALVPTVGALAVAAATAAAVTLLLAVVDEGTVTRVSAPRLLASHLAVAVAAATSGGLALDLWLQDRTGWWLAVLPLVLMLAFASEHARVRRRADDFGSAIEATRRIHDAADPREALQTMVEEIAACFDATGVDLRRLPPGDAAPTRIVEGDLSGAGPLVAHALLDTAAPVLLPVPDRGTARSGVGMAACITTPDGGEIEVRVVRGTDGERPYDRADLALFGDVVRATGFALETSQMHQTMERLEQLDEMKTAFLTAVSHDLRTPLAVVLAGLLTLERHGERLSDEQRDHMVHRMAVQGRRLDRMLLDLLDIDRLQRGVIEPRREELDVTAEVLATVDAVAVESHPVRVSDEPVTGLVDRGHLARIVENLVRNATKYTPEGTPVWVEVRRDATGTQLVVADAGPGVPEAQRAAIFGAFVRGDDSHPSPGTGVGLDLVRRLAELHGGSAWVDERPGGGARFWVTLPDEQPPAAPATVRPTG